MTTAVQQMAHLPNYYNTHNQINFIMNEKLTLIWAMAMAIAVAAANALPKGEENDGMSKFDRRARRINGGHESIPNSHPYIVAIQRLSEIICGGSIVTSEWVVTSALCATHPVARYRLSAGMHNLGRLEPEEQIKAVDRIVVHPQYGTGAYLQYDIALMHVSSPFDVNQFVQPIQLPPTRGMYPGPVLTVAGWGLVLEPPGSYYPSALREVDLPFVNDAECNSTWGSSGSTSEDMLCAGELGKGFCGKDHGGPLICTVNATSYLCGIASRFHMGDCYNQYADIPDVFTEVSYFQEWIEEVIGFPRTTITPTTIPTTTLPPEELQCPPEHPNGNFADPEDCTGFYTCEDNVVVGHSNCPDGFYFNPSIENCDYSWNVDCDL